MLGYIKAQPRSLDIPFFLFIRNEEKSFPISSGFIPLNKITNGNLKEEVSVYDSSEFASLSNDINQMVTALKGYIAATEKRVEQELSFAKSVQASALPKNYNFNRDDFEIYATMDPAKQVGGDFYDFFFVGPGKLALVISDVSVWLGIIDLNTGDSIFVYTDGIPEAEDVYESLYGLDRLKKALNETKKAHHEGNPSGSY